MLNTEPFLSLCCTESPSYLPFKVTDEVGDDGTSDTCLVAKAVSWRVCGGSQFKDMVHHDREGTAAELEVTGYTASTVRKQREAETGTQLTFSILFSPGPWHM